MNTIKKEMDTNDLLIKMAIDAWHVQIRRFNQFLMPLTEEQIVREVAIGKNSGIYLLGHLIAVTDGMLPLLGLQEKLYPELQDLFVTKPDKSGLAFPPFDILKTYWQEVNKTLDKYLKDMDVTVWLQRHTAVSEEDFIKEPHRNKLNILLSRTGHQSYHFGQMKLIDLH